VIASRDEMHDIPGAAEPVDRPLPTLAHASRAAATIERSA